MKKTIAKFMVVALCITISPALNTNAKTKISVTKSMNLTVKESKTIKVKGSYIKSRKYKSTNKKVATVNKKGKVTGKSKGNCRIIVTIKYKNTKKAKVYRTKKAICYVKVKNKKVATSTPKVTPTNTPTAKPSSKPTATPTNKPESPGETTTEKNANDVATLKKIIAEQKALGASVSEDLDSEQYTWEKVKSDDKEKRLVGIYWNCQQMKGNLSFEGLGELKKLECSENFENSLTNIDISKNIMAQLSRQKFNIFIMN